MLVRALKFRKAFVSMGSFETNYKTLPSEDEWNCGEQLSQFLKPFSVITTHFSAMKDMAESMQVKFDKYWKDYSLILAMGLVLDPRQKLERAYAAVDPFTAESKVEELKMKLTSLYENYQSRSHDSSSSVSGTQTPHELVTESLLEDDYDNDLFELERSIKIGVKNTKSHLDIYLMNRAYLACDVLSIPITTVASDSAFSIGSRVLTPFRNRLLLKNVQSFNLHLKLVTWLSRL